MRLRRDRWLKVGALAALTALSGAVSQVHAVGATPSVRVLEDDVVPGADRAEHLGALPQDAYLRLAFTLAARNKPGLDGYVSDVDDPGSPRYGRYLRVGQFADRFGRTAAEIDQVRTFLERNGFHVDDVHPGRLVIDASATAADVERTFRIRLDTWRDRSTGRVYYGNTTPPELPADPGRLLTDIAGLTDRAVREPTVSLGPVGGRTPGELGHAHGAEVPAHAAHSGPRSPVALVEFAGYRPQDIAVYDSRLAPGTPAPALRLVDGGPQDEGTGRDAVEAEIETVQAMAPGVATEVFLAENSPAGEIDAFQGVVDAGIAVAMTGWGAPEDQRTRSGMRGMDLVLEEGAAEGIGFYAASADPGHRGAQGATVPVLFPASDAYVTAVGVADDAGNGGAGTGRGRSAVFAQPWWQAQRGAPEPHGRREVPDATAPVASGPQVYCAGQWRTATGAGVATALWTVLAVRYDQSTSSCGGIRLGFAAPALYRLARSESSAVGARHDRGPVAIEGTRTLASPPCSKWPNG